MLSRPWCEITQVTRRRIFDFLSVDGVDWSGRIHEAAVLARLYPLKTLPSKDNRYRDAEGDIIQHRNAEPSPTSTAKVHTYLPSQDGATPPPSTSGCAWPMP